MLADLDQDRGELVAADARDHVGGADMFREQLRDMAQHRIAGPVAKLVVDGLEVIEVDESEHSGAAVPARDRQRPLELVIESATVVEAGQLVFERQLLERDEALALGGELLLLLDRDDQCLLEQFAHVGIGVLGVGTAGGDQAVGDDADVVDQLGVRHRCVFVALGHGCRVLRG